MLYECRGQRIRGLPERRRGRGGRERRRRGRTGSSVAAYPWLSSGIRAIRPAWNRYTRETRSLVPVYARYAQLRPGIRAPCPRRGGGDLTLGVEARNSVCEVRGHADAGDEDCDEVD
eukprot:449213-Rhodomonas_salina.2